ncbi:sigma factor-like helix-turn-helix DNA-binding protein [uncultured Ilyobacter sp.]|uniref:sigma factor-like helix-turn-helix DNA-binding protein n=1 Tax=uncultured Ilyobacter sp. TaxID=544433 RepID=UPI0029F59B5E|nr:sigma factor-like helix-turn-helix DNA-binding protein [uncultured Ilyobacter sp.]
MTWESYFDGEIKKVISTNNLLVLNSIKNKALTLFGIDISKEKLRVKIEETLCFYEIKDGFFVCKKYLEGILNGDESTLKKRLEFEYFLDFDGSDVERILSKKDIDKNEKIYADLNEYEKLAIYICARSPRHFIKRYRECFNNRYSSFIMKKNIYENGTVSIEAVDISKRIESKLRFVVGNLTFLKWVTLPEIKLEELWTILENDINKDLVYKLLSLLEEDNDKEDPKTDKQEAKPEETSVNIFECIFPDHITYSEEDLVVEIIKLIFKNKSSLKLNNLDIVGKFNCGCEMLISILDENRDLFYFASRKNVHFKPYIAGTLVDKFYGKKSSRVIVEKKMNEIFGGKSFNRAELMIFFSEFRDVFRWVENKLEVLMSPEEYINYVRSKYSPESIKWIEEIIDEKIDLQDAAEKLKISLGEMTSILNKRRGIFVKNGELEKISEETLEIKLEKINHWYKHMDEEYKSGFNNDELAVIVSRIVGNTPMNLDEIYKKLWLFRDRISKEEIKKLLDENKAFKKVSFTNYVVTECPLYSEFKNNFTEELDNVLSHLKDSEREVLRYRIIKKITLEEMGSKLKLTRERARQIEKKTLSKIQNSKSKNLIPYLNVIESIFQKRKIIKITELQENLNAHKAFRGVDIRYLLSIFEIFTGTELYFYFDKYVGIISREEFLKCLYKFINKPMEYKELAYELGKAGIENDEFLKDYTREDEQSENYKDFILIKDGKINSGDRIRLIFYSEERDLKISEIVTLYENQYGNDMSDHNIQTKLGHYENLFTRVFTGTYSLAEWGAEKHVYVTDLIEEYLRKIKRPASYQEILDNVKGRTLATEVSIRAYICSCKKTFSYNYGEWALIEWKDDPELSKKYYISENRIKASFSGLTHIQHKGHFEKNGKRVSLHMAGGAYFKHSGSMNLGASVFDQDRTDIFIYVRDRNFEFTTYGSSGQSIYGVKDMLEYAGIKVGDYFYLEYWPDGNIKLYTWDEFESYSESGEFPKKQWEEKGEGKKPEEGQEISEPIGVYKSWFTFDEILSHGLETGLVDTEMLSKIDYSKEKIVKDVYEAMEALEERGVRVPM